MRIIHGRGFSEDERKAFAKCIFQNIFTAMKAMTGAMSMLRIPYSNPENEVEKHSPESALIHLAAHKHRSVYLQHLVFSKYVLGIESVLVSAQNRLPLRSTPSGCRK